MKSAEDKQKIHSIKRDIFDTSKTFKDIIDKHFGWIDDIKICNSNIAYENRTCKIVSNQIRKLLNKKDEFEIGDVMICKEYLKMKNTVFNVNFRFRIMGINGEIMTLQNIKTLEEQTVLKSKLRTNFIYSYCFTAHSFQGCSVDDDIIVYDWNKPYVSREWLFVACSRARDLNRVKFFRY